MRIPRESGTDGNGGNWVGSANLSFRPLIGLFVAEKLKGLTNND